MPDSLQTNVRQAAALLQAVWERYVAAISASLTTKAAAAKELAAAFPEWGKYALNDWKNDPKEKEVFNDLLRCLVEAMTRELRAAGLAPEIDLDSEEIYGEVKSYRDFCEENEDAWLDHDSLEQYARYCMQHAATRSIPAVAETLLQQFTPEKAKAAALAQAVERVTRYLSPRWGGVPEIKDRGRVKVIEAGLSTNFDRWQVDHSSRSLIARTVQDMSVLLSQSGVDAIESSHALCMFANRGDYTSRMAIPCGPGLTLVFFKGRVEFQFAPATLDALQIAMAPYLHQDAQAA